MQRKTHTLCVVAAPALLALAMTCLLAPVDAGLWSSPETKEDPPVLTAKPVALVTSISGFAGSRQMFPQVIVLGAWFPASHQAKLSCSLWTCPQS